jgi:hypothetical protein
LIGVNYGLLGHDRFSVLAGIPLTGIPLAGTPMAGAPGRR